jgi:hypothetical protein
VEVVIDFGIFYLEKTSQPKSSLSHDVGGPVALSVDAKHCLILEVVLIRMIDAGEDLRLWASGDILVCVAKKSSSGGCKITGVSEDNWDCGV